MRGFGSGEYGEFTFLDYINIVGFLIGLENLNLNITQEDMDKQTADLDARVNAQIHEALTEIHQHLKVQDDKLNKLLKLLEDKNDS